MADHGAASLAGDRERGDKVRVRWPDATLPPWETVRSPVPNCATARPLPLAFSNAPVPLTVANPLSGVAALALELLT